MQQIDWRLPENRREAFRRFYQFHLDHKTHPGCVYSFLPALAEKHNLGRHGRAWLAWLNGNTQNPITTSLLLEAAPSPKHWQKAVAFWEAHYADLEWDTDRRHQKRHFGAATAAWAVENGKRPADGWLRAAEQGWSGVWAYATAQPFMGRLSAWSMIEYMRILFGKVIPDAEDLILKDVSGSRSHRNGLGLLLGHDSTYWEGPMAAQLGLLPEMNALAKELIAEANHPDACYLTLESALCTYKSWHKPNRRYPNVYADMAYYRIKRAEALFGPRFDVFWLDRERNLPPYLRLEASPLDPGLVADKQNHYLETGCPVMLHKAYPSDMNDGWYKTLTQPRKERKFRLNNTV